MLNVIKGDITSLEVDIVVNAANKSLLGGGGVDGAIHRKAGRELLEECRTLHGCETGQAKMTKGYNMPCKRIIHTVGPVYSNKESDPINLYNCYANSMKLAYDYMMEEKLNKVSIAFPCISTGIYGYPKEEAAKIAIQAVKENSFEGVNVYFVCFEEEDYSIYNNLLK